MSEKPIIAQRGFSLLELLVVVAIVFILMALLMPAYQTVRKESQRIGCISNLGSLNKVIPLFATSNNGQMPGANWWYGPAGWLYGQGHSRMDSKEDVQTGQFWPYMKNMEPYRCPGDDSADKLYDLPWRPRNARAVTSYGANGSWTNYSNSRAPYNLSQFMGEDVFIWEVNEASGRGAWHDGANSPNEGLTSRHGERPSVACADGRVEELSIDDYYALLESARRDPNWKNNRTMRINRLYNVPAP